MQTTAQPGSSSPTQGTASIAAELSSVSRIYGSFAALRNISVSIPAGACTVILGENGAGKSTLLRLLAGLIAPTRGTLSVLGGTPQKLRARIAYMSHAPMLYDELTALENLHYFAGLNRDEGCDCVGSPEMALRAVGLDPTLSRPLSQYSQGMRQRASLARVLQSDPELLLLDEPFSNLDVASSKQMVDLLADFRSWPLAPINGVPRQRTIILTTHQAHLITAIADQTITMQQGQIVSISHRTSEPAA